MGSSAPAAIRQSIRPISLPTPIPIDTTDFDALPARRARERTLGWTAALLVLAATFAGDYLTGEQVSFSLCYMVSIGLAAWFVGRGAALVLATLSTSAWLGSYFLVGHPYAHPSSTGTSPWRLAST